MLFEADIFHRISSLYCRCPVQRSMRQPCRRRSSSTNLFLRNLHDYVLNRKPVLLLRISREYMCLAFFVHLQATDRTKRQPRTLLRTRSVRRAIFEMGPGKARWPGCSEAATASAATASAAMAEPHGAPGNESFCLVSLFGL